MIVPQGGLQVYRNTCIYTHTVAIRTYGNGHGFVGHGNGHGFGPQFLQVPCSPSAVKDLIKFPFGGLIVVDAASVAPPPKP